MVAELHIKGGPGSGKTTSGQNLVAEYIKDGAFEPREIIALSFTRTAVAELTRRGILDEDNVGTIHSFGYRLLGTPAVIGGERKGNKADVTSEWNRLYPGYQIAYSQRTNFWRDPDEAFEGLPLGSEILAHLDIHRQRLEPIDDWTTEQWYAFWRRGGIHGIQPEGLPLFWQRYQAFKYENDCIDFTDMVELPYQRDYGPPVAECEMVWVDEAQDLTPLQLRRIRQMARDCKLLLFTYDDDQCLYEHLGADPTLLFHEKPDSGSIQSLPYSYRMGSAITDFSQRWIKRNSDRIDMGFESFPERGQGAVIRVEESYEADLTEYVKGAYDGGETLMILTSCGYMADKVASSLRESGYPFYNPYRVINGRWNPLHDNTREAVAALYQREYNAGSVKWWLDHYKTQGLVVNATAWRDKLKEMPALKSISIEEVFTEEGRRVINDINKWDEFAGSKTPAGVDMAVRIVTLHGIDMLLAEPRVIVGTIHSVKGGEADAVLLFPDQSKAAVEEGDPAAAIRQFYVGMTRAKETLLLGEPTGWSRRKGYEVDF